MAATSHTRPPLHICSPCITSPHAGRGPKIKWEAVRIGAHKAVYHGEWARSACALPVASSDVYPAPGMLRALRKAEAQCGRQERVEERLPEFRKGVKADHRREAGTAGTDPSKPSGARCHP
ncbi:MAG: hypothetical protein JWM59_4325 [Verrucomicrobiales bacterium]|nr:hypothetical protein [Verrucomicrobiales bacterium]